MPRYFYQAYRNILDKLSKGILVGQLVLPLHLLELPHQIPDLLGGYRTNLCCGDRQRLEAGSLHKA